MIDSRYVTGFAFGAGSVFLIFLFGGQLDAYTLEGLREWLGATSGWMAAMAAFAVGLPTIKLLRDQTKYPVVDGRIQEIHAMQQAISQFRDWVIDELNREFILDYEHERGEDAFYLYLGTAQSALEDCAKSLPAATAVQVRNSLSVMDAANDQIISWENDDRDERVPSIGVTEIAAKKLLRKLMQKTNRADRTLTNQSKKLAGWKNLQLPS